MTWELKQDCESCMGIGGFGFNNWCRQCGGRGYYTVTGRMARLWIAFHKVEKNHRAPPLERLYRRMARLTSNPSHAEQQRRDAQRRRNSARH